MGKKRGGPGFLLIPAILLLVFGPRTASAGLDHPPLDCAIGADQPCFIASYMDLAPGPDIRDYRCGPRSRNDSASLIIALRPRAFRRGDRPLAQAVARGRVVEFAQRAPLGAGRDEGSLRNAGITLVLDHGMGWQSLYSDLGPGSLRVQPGDSVAPGTPLGQPERGEETGLIQLAFSLWQGDLPRDPFSGRRPDAALCPGTEEKGEEKAAWDPTQPVALEEGRLWTRAAAAQMPYEPAGIVSAGFTSVMPKRRLVLADGYHDLRPERDSTALLFFVEAFGLALNDSYTIRLLGPDGRALAEQTASFLHPHPWPLLFIGYQKPRTETGSEGGEESENTGQAQALRPPGPYRGQFILRRRGRPIASVNEILVLE